MLYMRQDVIFTIHQLVAMRALKEASEDGLDEYVGKMESRLYDKCDPDLIDFINEFLNDYDISFMALQENLSDINYIKYFTLVFYSFDDIEEALSASLKEAVAFKKVDFPAVEFNDWQTASRILNKNMKDGVLYIPEGTTHVLGFCSDLKCFEKSPMAKGLNLSEFSPEDTVYCSFFNLIPDLKAINIPSSVVNFEPYTFAVGTVTVFPQESEPEYDLGDRKDIQITAYNPSPLLESAFETDFENGMLSEKNITFVHLGL